MNKQPFFVILLCFAFCAAEALTEDKPLHPRFQRDACTGHKCPPNTVCIVANVDCIQDGPGCGAQATCLPK